MALRILADENIPALQHYFASLGELRQMPGRAIERTDLQGVDVLLVRSVTRVDASLLADSALTFVGSATSGVDHIDRQLLQDRGICFADAAGANANAVVEYVLNAIANVGDHLERLLDSGRVGIVGYGNVGRTLSARLARLGIDYCVYDPWQGQGALPNAADLVRVLASQVVSLHPQLTLAEPWPSHHLIAESQLAQLGDGQLLLNTSRGEVVDNVALSARLADADAPSTVLDVWEREPDISAELLKRVTLATPHIAGYSTDAKYRATALLYTQLLNHLQLARPQIAEPLGHACAVELSNAPRAAAFLRGVLGARYDVCRDDAALRRVVTDRAAGMASQGFDALRRDYPLRRELAGSRVAYADYSVQQQNILRALECAIEPVQNGL